MSDTSTGAVPAGQPPPGGAPQASDTSTSAQQPGAAGNDLPQKPTPPDTSAPGKQPPPSGGGPDPGVGQGYTGIDRAVIIVLIAAFAAGFVWLWYQDENLYPTKPLYLHLFFVSLATVILVGILRAFGQLKIEWLALSGSAAVFCGILWITGGVNAFTSFYDANKRVADLTRIHAQKIADDERAHKNALESQRKAHDEETGKLNGRIVGLNDANGLLQRQFEEMRTALDGIRNQDLEITTFDARSTRPMRIVRILYWLDTGDENFAKLKDTAKGTVHVIPRADVPRVKAILLELDLAEARPERAGATDTAQRFEVERMNVRTAPLQIELYLRQRRENPGG